MFAHQDNGEQGRRMMANGLAQAAAQTIARLPPKAPSGSFDALRAAGIQHLQALSSSHWTDYNLHDPGVTLLEALCFALTEQIYCAQADVATHLADEQQHIDWAGHALPLPEDAYPTRPCTPQDQRRWLLDQVHGLAAVQVLVCSAATNVSNEPGGDEGVDATSGACTDPNAPAPTPRSATLPGLLSLLLDADEGADAPALEQSARTAFHAARQLGEDLASVAHVHTVQTRLLGELSIGGTRDAADVVADVFDRCARYLACATAYDSPADFVAQGDNLDAAYEGPATLRGRAQARLLARSQEQVLFITDLIACLGASADHAAVDGLTQTHWLALEPFGDVTSGNINVSPYTAVNTPAGAALASSASVAWRSADGSRRLSLALPGANSAGTANNTNDDIPGLVVRRRGALVQVSALAVRRRCAELSAERQAQRAGLQSLAQAYPAPQAQNTAPASPTTPTAWLSLQHLLPAVYGVGEHGVPGSATLAEKARSHQLAGYLLLFDQMLANGDAQTRQLRHLWRVTAAPTQSYWRGPLQPSGIPGLPELLDTTTFEMTQQQVLPYDDALERKSRLLDVLLALQGQTYAQNTLRQCWSQLSPFELRQRLYDNKRDFLLALPQLSAERAAGINITQDSWGSPDCTSGLQRHLGFLLGFSSSHSRSLVGALRQRELVSSFEFLAQEKQADAGVHTLPADTQRAPGERIALGLQATARSAEQVRADLALLPLSKRRKLSSALLRCAARHDRYQLRQQGEQLSLILGPDEDGQHWQLAHFAPAQAAQARHCAASLRQAMQQIDSNAEGLHVIEHVLLRPQADVPLSAADHDFFSQRLSVVFPAWTVRGADANFQHLATEAVQMNCPAHLHAQCLWLQAPEMAALEAALHSWLTARVQLAKTPGADASGNADKAALALKALLQAHAAQA